MESTERKRLRINERRRDRYASAKRARLLDQTSLLSCHLPTSSSAMADELLERKRLRTNERQRDRYASKKRARLLGPTPLVPSALASSSSAFSDAGAADPRVVNNRCVSRNESARARYASMGTSNKAALITRISDHQATLRATKSSNIQTDASVASSSTYDNIASSRSIEQFRALQFVYQSPWFLPTEDICEYCGAYRFYRECAGFCCAAGQICFPKSVCCPIMWFLFTSVESELAVEFRRRVRSYNGAFAFTSIGMTVDENSWWARDGIYALKVVGQVSHFLNAVKGSANVSKMLQLFFLDTADDLSNEMLEKKEFRRDIMSLLIDALSVNPYALFFKRLSAWENLSDAYIVLRSDSVLDQRTYNLPTIDQVAAVWKDGEGDGTGLERDIRVFTESGQSRKISYYYGCYDTLQYPLLFTRGEPGWHAGIQKLVTSNRSRRIGSVDACSGQDIAAASVVRSAEQLLQIEDEVLQQNRRNRSNVSCRQYYCYKAQMRDGDWSYLLHAGRLTQQYIIDMYIKVETQRLDYYRSEQIQKETRTESYQGIIDSLDVHGEIEASDIRKKVLLPSSFIGGPRDMRRRYVNAMALVQKFGKPDLFITMTCNPAWKEITSMLLPGQKTDDRPDLVARVFQSKLQELKHDIVKKKNLAMWRPMRIQ